MCRVVPYAGGNLGSEWDLSYESSSSHIAVDSLRPVRDKRERHACVRQVEGIAYVDDLADHLALGPFGLT